MEMGFLYALAMVTLGIAQSEQSLLQEGVLLVPKRKGDILEAVSVGHTGNAVLAPPVRPRSSMFMRKMTPCIAIV